MFGIRDCADISGQRDYTYIHLIMVGFVIHSVPAAARDKRMTLFLRQSQYLQQ